MLLSEAHDPFPVASREPAPTACHLPGITLPFVLILVDISFHTLLNEPLQKGVGEKFALAGEESNMLVGGGGGQTNPD